MALTALGYSAVPPIRQVATFAAIGSTAVAAVLVGVVLHRPRRGSPWYLIAAGLALFVLGDAISGGQAGAAPQPPTGGDLLSIAAYLLLAAGLLMLFRRRNPHPDREGTIDTIILTVAAGYLSWVYLIGPSAEDGVFRLATRVNSAAHPLMDLLVLAAAVRLGIGGGKRGPAFRLLLLSIAALLATDAVHAFHMLHGGVAHGGLLDQGWIAFFGAAGAAALHPSMRTVEDPAADHEPRLSHRRLVLLTMIAVAVPIIGALQISRHEQIETPIRLVASLTLFLLCVVRLTNDLHRREARFRSLVQNSSDVVAVLNPDGAVRYLSTSIRRIFGYDPEALVGSRLTEWLIHPDDAPRVMAALEAILRGDRSGSEPFETRWRRADGTWLHMESVLTDLSRDPSVGGVIMNSRDVSERRGFERELQHRAFHDSLTGLANRELFRDRVEHTIAGLSRHPRPLAVLFVDLDDFKTVNDSLGHAAGDRLLIEVAERLKLCARTADTVARLGGDEFALLLDDCELGRGIEVAERILAALEERVFLDGKEVFFQGSVGIAPFELPGSGAPGVSDAVSPWQAEELLRQADVAMYIAKSSGKGRHEVFQPEMHRDVVRRLELKADLQRAIEGGEFFLDFQPIRFLDSGRLSGVEALVRWHHPVKGLLQPLDFIPLAEETGLVVPIGRWVLMESCHVGTRLHEAHPSDPPLRMSVNLSARQLQHASLIDDVRDALVMSRFPPTSLVLEITESVMMQNVELAVQRLHELKRLGVRFALDDFGTGYSSLNYLRQFPVDILKIDKSFIEGIATGGEQSVLTAAIIHLAGSLNLTSVAEGIEDPTQLARLLDMHCDQGQGFFLGEPLDEAALRIALGDGLPASR